MDKLFLMIEPQTLKKENTIFYEIANFLLILKLKNYFNYKHINKLYIN